jgi:type 1 fimbria pilin
MRILLNLFVLVSMAGAVLAQTPTTLDRDFVSGGDVRLQLSAGAYKISASTDNKIHLSWSTRDASALKKVKVNAEVKGTDAKITTDGPDNQNFTVDIQIPARSNVGLRFTAGEMRMEGIEGNKDIYAYAGDLSVDVVDPASYKEVHASVTTGDLNAAPFHISKGGLFRSFDLKGSGPYTLRVRLRAGDLKLYQRKKDSA